MKAFRTHTWLYGAAIALGCVALVDGLTNTISPPTQYDSTFYVDMAEHGLWGNPNLAAPFAYRPLVPLLVQGIAATTGAAVDPVFYWLARAVAAALIFSVWALAFEVAGTALAAAAAALAAAFSFYVLKLPLFWHTLVDIEALLVMVWSVHALTLGRRRFGLALACAGILMKEFVVIPALLSLAAGVWGKRRAKRGELLVGALAVLAAIALPRVAISVANSYQSVDPIHAAGWLGDLAIALEPSRWLSVGFSMLAFMMPALILASPKRIARLRALGSVRLGLGAVYLALVALLSLLGGSDMPRFSAYLLPLLTIALAVFLEDEPRESTRAFRVLEIAIALGATFAFNRIWIAIPDPLTQLAPFAEVFGGHGECSGPRLAARAVELALFIGVGATLASLARYRSALAD